MKFNGSAIAGCMPGQNSQEAGMGYEAYMASEEAKRIYHIGGQVTGQDLREFCWGSRTDELNGVIVQPALGAAILADLALKKEKGFSPDLFMGQSVSEIIALTAAGGIPVEDMFRILTIRAVAMDDAQEANPSIMTAFPGLSREQVDWIVNAVNAQREKLNLPGVARAISNSLEQHVAGGHPEAIARMKRMGEMLHRIKKINAHRAITVKEDGASHTENMRPAVPRLHEEICRAVKKPPTIPVLANNGRYLIDPEKYADYLSNQLVEQADWHLSMWVAVMSGIRKFVEVEGKDKRTLTNLARREFPEHQIVKEAFGKVIVLGQLPELPESIRDQVELLVA